VTCAWPFNITRPISLPVTLHNSRSLQLFRQLPPRQIPNVHLAVLFHLNPRAHEHTKTPLRTTSILLSTRLTPPKLRQLPKQQTMCSVTLISQHNCSRSRHLLHILLPLPTRVTHIRNRRRHNIRNTRQVHKVSGLLWDWLICSHMPFHRTKQWWRGATAVL
jgi:hypothetical protein